MNYYEHHIGDFIKATAHLSMLEDAAYRRLIDAYYSREAPLPTEKKACYRLVRANSKTEKSAVDVILFEFFSLGDDGWHQKRCDEEIEKYFAKKPDADKKKESERERQKRARERRKALFEELSGLGINMPWNATTEQLQAELSRVTSGDESQNVTPPVTRDNTATQSPVPSPQSPSIKTKEVIAASTADSTSDEKHEIAADPIQVRSVELTTLLRKRGAALQASDPRVREWASSGITDAQALTALETAQQRRHEQNSPQPVNAGYLDSILKASQSTATAAKPMRQSIHDQRADTIAELTGANRHERSTATERDITAESVRVA